MEKIWIMNCPKCSQELPQGLRNKDIMETMNVNCPKCGWKGLAKDTSYKATTYEDWMGPGYTKENSFLSQQDYEELLKDEKGRVNLDPMFANYNTPEPRFDREKEKKEPRREEKKDEEDDWGERINNMVKNRFTPQQVEVIERKFKQIEEVKVDDPEAVETWHAVKDLLTFDTPKGVELKIKWEEALAKKKLKC